MSFNYDVESISKISEAGETFGTVNKPISEAFAELLEVATESGMPKLVKSVTDTTEAFDNGFAKTNNEMVELCEKDAELWKKIASAVGAE